MHLSMVHYSLFFKVAEEFAFSRRSIFIDIRRRLLGVYAGRLDVVDTTKGLGFHNSG